MRYIVASILLCLGFVAVALAPQAPVFNDFTTGTEGWTTYGGTQSVNANNVLVTCQASGFSFFTITDEGNRVTYSTDEQDNPYFVSALVGGGDPGATLAWKLRVYNSSGSQVTSLAQEQTAVPWTDPTRVDNFSHTFNVPAGGWPAGGSLEVRLSVYGFEVGECLDMDHVTRQFNPVTPPPNQPPVAGFSFSPSNPTTNDLVTFTDTSTDPDGSSDIVSRAWDVDGDGTVDSTAPGPISFGYGTPGTYQAKLTVTDSVGNVDDVINPITVSEPPIGEPPAPGNFRLTNQDGSCLVEWDPVTGAESYEVYINGVWPGPFTTHPDTDYIHQQANGTTSEVRVSAYDAQADTFDDNRLTTNGAPAEDGHGPWTVALTCQPVGEPPPPPACSDQIDNDADGLIDFPADPGCTSATDDSEVNLPPPAGDIFDEPFPNSPVRRPAAGIAFDQFSSNLVNIGLANAMTVNSGRGPTIFTDATRFRGTASDPVWTMIGSGVGGSTTIHAPQNIGDSGGIDPTIVIHDVSTGKTARMYCGSGGTCSYDRTNHVLRGANLGVDTNGDGQAEQGAGTAWRRLNPEGAALASDLSVMDHRVGVALGNNDNAVGQFRFPALAQEVQATGSAYPNGVPMGTTWCHLWTVAEIDAMQNANGMTGITRQFSDSFTEATSCERGYGIVTRDGTGTNGFNLYINTGELGLTSTQGQQAVRIGAGGGASTSIPFWENLSKWRTLVAG